MTTLSTVNVPLMERIMQRMMKLQPQYPNMLSLPVLDGLMTALVCGASSLPLQDGLPIIFGVKSAAELPHDEDLIKDLNTHYEQIRTCLQAQTGFVPMINPFTDEAGNAIEEGPDAPYACAIWAYGFFRGMLLWQEKTIENFTAMGSVMTILRYLPPSMMKGAELTEINEQFLESYFDALDDFMKECPLPQTYKEAVFEVVAATIGLYKARQDDKVKTRPNDPCPCGSGLKFKRCCGLDTHNAS